MLLLAGSQGTAESFFSYIFKYKSEKWRALLIWQSLLMCTVTFLLLLLHLHPDMLRHIFMGHIASPI